MICCPLPHQNRENRAPKCLPFSILCAYVAVHTENTYKYLKYNRGVNSNAFCTARIAKRAVAVDEFPKIK